MQDILVAPVSYSVDGRRVLAAEPGTTALVAKKKEKGLRRRGVDSDADLESCLASWPVGGEDWHDACLRLAIVLGSRGDGAGRDAWLRKSWKERLREVEESKIGTRLACLAASRVPTVEVWRATLKAISKLGDTHPDAIVAAIELCRSLCEDNKPEEAKHIAARLAALRARTLGKSHPVTRSARQFLAEILAIKPKKIRDFVEEPCEGAPKELEEDDVSWELARAAIRIEKKQKKLIGRESCNKKPQPLPTRGVAYSKFDLRKKKEKEPIEKAEIALDDARYVMKRLEDATHPNLLSRELTAVPYRCVCGKPRWRQPTPLFFDRAMRRRRSGRRHRLV